MSVQAELPFERFRYWQGQMMRARDFRDQLAEVERQTRWHNRAVHDAFGVRSGFEVTLLDTMPPRIRIDCGVAFDCSGAMLVLQRSRELEIPALNTGESAVLLVRAHDGHCSCGCQGHAGGGGHHLDDDLLFEWERRHHGNPDAGVPLARASRDTVTSIDQSIRPLARPLARAQLVSGATIPGLTPWEPWAAGVQTRIDTSAAGFTRIPRYFATLLATRRMLSFAELNMFFLTHVAEAGITEFTFRIVSPERRRRNLGFTELARTLGLVVCWIGCQPPEFVPPACPGLRPTPSVCSQRVEDVS